MKKSKNIYIIQYEKLSAFLSGLNEKERTDFESGKLRLNFQLLDKNSKKPSKIKPSKIDNTKLNSIINELNTFKTRKEGLDFLKSNCSSKVDYEKIAKVLDIHFLKKDTINRLQEKIIESTIGYKLRSQAIQGNNDTNK